MESVLDISAHKYGNYHKYYTFHPSSARTSFFTSSNVFFKLWEAQGRPDEFRILDIGCNEGNLSIDILEEAKKELPNSVNCSLVGIDIDSSLIELANTKYSTPESKNITFKPINFMDPEETRHFMIEYFKTEMPTATAAGFNVVCLFSITMWIHLNHDDKGLIDCLIRATQLLSPLGSLVVEPQPWKCYKSADKRCRKLGLTRPLFYNNLLIRDIEKEIIAIICMHPDVNASLRANTEISELLNINLNIKSHWDLGKEGWGRSILIFHRSNIENLTIEPLAVSARGSDEVCAPQPTTVVIDKDDNVAEVGKDETFQDSKRLKLC